MELIEERVKRGAKWLDGTVPEWEKLVTVTELNIGDCFGCVLGQVSFMKGENKGYGIHRSH